jgi:hypothetical protein
MNVLHLFAAHKTPSSQKRFLLLAVRRLNGCWLRGAMLVRRLLQLVCRNSLNRANWKIWTSSIAPNWPSSQMRAGAVALCRKPAVHIVPALLEPARPSPTMRTDFGNIWRVSESTFHESMQAAYTRK